MFLVFAVCMVFILILFQIRQSIFGDLHLKSFRARVPIYIVTIYFIDTEKYFYLILLHVLIAFCIVLFAIIGTGTMLIGYLKHACGMFKIAR